VILETQPTLAVPARTTIFRRRIKSLTHEMAIEAYALPGAFHRDPADRVLVAAARLQGWTLLTADDRILEYRDVRSLDARR